MLYPSARYIFIPKSTGNTQEAVAPSRHDSKNVDWDVKPQPKQTNKQTQRYYTIYNCKQYENLGPQPSRDIENERKLKERGEKIVCPVGV